jgi:hypothetical protein
LQPSKIFKLSIKPPTLSEPVYENPETFRLTLANLRGELTGANALDLENLGCSQECSRSRGPHFPPLLCWIDAQA